MSDNMVKLEMMVPAEALEDARQAVQDVIDEYARPPLPMPCWAVPVTQATFAHTMSGAAAAQSKAAAEYEANLPEVLRRKP
jgi:hypothetical protein